MHIDRVSLELTNTCDKGCAFCYNGSQPNRGGDWSVDEVIAFLTDCAQNGVAAASLGGGEPLQFEGWDTVLKALDGILFRSMTTNGLLLDKQFDTLLAARPDKVHVSVHFPERKQEVSRVARQVASLREAGIHAGVNLLVRPEHKAKASLAAFMLRKSGVEQKDVVYLPMKGPGPQVGANDIARVAMGPFQSVTCLTKCRRSPRFVSIDAQKQVAFCSYTTSRKRMAELSFTGMTSALHGLGLRPCNEAMPTGSTGVVHV